MKWWLTPRQEAGEDATFFADESFGYEKLLRDFDETSLVMRSWRSAGATDPAIIQLARGVKELHKNFSRLVACYLIYRNASREELCAEARDFGVDVTVPPPENPLRFWIVYVIALIASVYVGVYASAIAYDWFSGQGINIGDFPIGRSLGPCTRLQITEWRSSRSCCFGSWRDPWETGCTSRI